MTSSTTSIRPEDVIRRIGDTNERALTYVMDPDPQLSRLSRKVKENIIADLPPVTAGALLGPAALARHFIASAASGRYRDLFALWTLFRRSPEECRPVLAERQRALEKARGAMTTAVRLGLSGHAERVAEDVRRAEGLIWQWLRQALVGELPRVGQRPAVASALLLREPGIAVSLPPDPDERWLAEAAAARQDGELAPPVDALLAAGADRLPATIATLQLAQEHYPERVPDLVSRIDLESPQIVALMAWSRDHGLGDRVVARVQQDVEEAVALGRAEGVTRWHAWRERGVQVELPASLRAPDLEGLDVSRPETAALAAELVAGGAPIDVQGLVEELATRNRQLAEKAYEAYVCAGLDVTLPAALVGNPLVKEGTRCPYCQSWTYVRAGHERRCPRRPADAPVVAVPDSPGAAPVAPPEKVAVAGPEGVGSGESAWDEALAEDLAAAGPAPAPPTEPAVAEAPVAEAPVAEAPVAEAPVETPVTEELPSAEPPAATHVGAHPWQPLPESPADDAGDPGVGDDPR